MATKEQQESGWQLDVNFLQSIKDSASAISLEEIDQISLESIESVLLAANAYYINEVRKNIVNIPDDIMNGISETGKECQKSWGMGFPVISITLLKQILNRKITA